MWFHLVVFATGLIKVRRSRHAREVMTVIGSDGSRQQSDGRANNPFGEKGGEARGERETRRAESEVVQGLSWWVSTS